MTMFQPNHFVPLLPQGYILKSENDFPTLASSDIAPNASKSKSSSAKRKNSKRKRQVPITVCLPTPNSRATKSDITLSNSQTQTQTAKRSRPDWIMTNHTQPTQDGKILSPSQLSVNIDKVIDPILDSTGQEYAKVGENLHEGIDEQINNSSQPPKGCKSQPATSSHQLPFPSLSRKWYQGQALHETKLNASARMGNRRKTYARNFAVFNALTRLV